MIDTVDLKKSISIEEDNIIKEIKFESLDKLKLSYKKYKEEYKYTPLLRNIEKKYGSFNSSENIKKADSYKDLVSTKDKHYIVTLNGSYIENLSNIPNSIDIKNIKDLSKNEQNIFIDSYSKIDDSTDDIFSSINTILHSNCLTFKINKSTILKEKISIINIVDSSKPTYFRKCFIIDKNSEISFSEEFINVTKDGNFSNSVTEIYMDENAVLNYFSTQNISKNYHFNSINVFQKRNSTSNFHTYSFSGSIIRNNLNIKLLDKSCYANMYGFYAIKNSSHIDNHTSVDHIDENSISNEHYKGIVDDGSNGVFNGKIFVRQKAQKTNAFQSNNNILLSDNAKVNTKPQLEIWADDVKCSHGCTVGQLDDDALFYLMSRGISRKDAISLLLSAFSTDITEKIADKVIREEYQLMILKELEGLNYE
tara:strand:+ start:1504 stop:2772 length:1269 start_codon:yes stop_codon:yes gene_type:complete